jgi:hypothetical protein
MPMSCKYVDHKFVHKCEEGQSIFLVDVGHKCSFLVCFGFVSNSEPDADVVCCTFSVCASGEGEDLQYGLDVFVTVHH